MALTRKIVTVPAVLAAVVLAALVWYACVDGRDKKPATIDEILTPYQTSAKLLVRYAELKASQAPGESKTPAEQRKAGKDKLQAEQRLLILYDLYIKARSYAFFNKLFFWVSMPLAILVLVWPSIGVFVKKQGSDDWVRSPILQTTLTGVAALAFAFYSEYKDKQAFTENLMRYVSFSKEDPETLSNRIREEMAKIDKGFSFSAPTKNDSNDGSTPADKGAPKK